ncbi:hypothetical protein THTE_4379 [Thermogutta terrifontis]|jgi:hypothetical protein|uniref:Uncharacterized protein n=1 Tax=Thermogutta terrifontis TaxID=1331910 RepID=A0A286RM03_9BACT|nr:hypothetical protein [Thermogutta terrifontis]ASV76980.1 hypothetical protein THTE_4379 [Thermogutta terrifontis]
MSKRNGRDPNEIELLLRNAELRTELEPYYDDSLTRVNIHQWPLAAENEYLASMLAWEMAPVLPIYRWFEPELRLPRPETLDDQRLHEILWDTIHKLYEKRIVLEFTDHLSDRELYCLIYRDILPSREKKLDLGTNYLRWDCAFVEGDPEIWLRYYATDEEREAWAATYRQPLPPKEKPPYPRDLPKAPF